jgi:hypothetical protein
MTRTPQSQSDDPGPPDSRQRRPPRAGWIGWLRPGEWIARVRSWARATLSNRLLFLDDDPNRAALFLKDHPQAIWVTTVPDCLARLAESWHEVHLDHDLGGKMYVDSTDTDCGMEVIRWLCKEPRPHLKRTRFFVHTHNATAGLWMVLLMQCGGYKAEFRPFGHDLQTLLAHNETGASPGPDAETRHTPWIGRIGSLHSLRRAVAAGLAAIASGRARLYFGLARGEPPRLAGRESAGDPTPDAQRAAGGAQSGPADGDAQRAAPESAPAIQPPPRTRSS